MPNNRCLRFTPLCLVVLSFWIGAIALDDQRRHKEGAVASERRSAITFDLQQLEGPEPDRRREAYAAMRDEHAAMIRRLENIVKSAGQRESGSTKALAAQLLGDWHALETVPALAMEMKYHAPGYTDIARLFDFDQYPCAKAIRNMGRSALQPFIASIAKRKTLLDNEEVRIASHIVYAILEYNKSETLELLQGVQAKYAESPHFAPMREYVEERIPDIERPR